MIYTLNDLRKQVLRNLDEEGDTGTTYNLVTNLLNQANQNRCMEYANQFLVWDLPVVLTTEVGRVTYALHSEFMRPLYFFNRVTKRYLEEVPERELGPEGYRWNDATGSAGHFVLWGRTQVKRQPTSRSILSIVSSDPIDTGGTGAFDVFVRGETVNGEVASETLRPLGTTPVNTSNSYTKIMQVTRAGPWTGTMTMTSNSAAVTNLILDGCELGKMYQQLYLLETPTVAEDIEYRFYRNPIRMTNDYDLPDVPYPFSQILVWDALVMMSGYNTEMNPQAVMTWKQMQSDMQIAMTNNFLEGQSLEARVRFVRPFGDSHIDHWGILRS
jgi:hypothetical protein